MVALTDKYRVTLLRRPRALAALLVSAVLPLAQTVSAQGFRSAIADAWIEEAAPLANHGTDAELRIKNQPSGSFRALIAFDLSGLPPNANVTRAEARFRITNTDDTGLPVNIYAVTDSWDEVSVNWSNTGNDYDPGTIHGSFVADRAGFATVDLVPLVQAWICGEIPDHGLMLIPTSANDESRYASREWNSAGFRPRLRLTVAGTNPCVNAADHFVITHDTFGINCLAEAITVRVEDAINNPLTSYTETVTLDTQTGRGSWTLVFGSGTFSDATADDGLATYQWASGESEATFALSYPEGAVPLDVDVFQSDDTSLRDTDSEGPLTFSANGFTLTATPLSNPPPGVIIPFDQAQTAAVPFPLYIAAFGQTANDPVCGIIESYTGSKDLKFWSTYLNPGSGTRSVEIDANPVATTEAAAALQTVVFTNGQAAVGAKYKDVGSLQIAVKDDTIVNVELPFGIRGATTGFVSRPASFEISNIFDAGGTIPDPEAADHNGLAFIAAGAPFQVTVTALDAEGDATPNYGQEGVPESVRLDSILVGPGGGVNPAVSAATGFGSFSAGTATGYDFVWPEVGIIRLRPGIGDADYLGAGDVTGTDSVNVGRFVPSHFTLALNSPSLDTQCDAGGFTYTGERFGFALAPMITAIARSVSGTTTLNYTGLYFKMATTTLANRNYAWTGGTLDLSGLPAVFSDPAVSETALGEATIVFSSGTGLFFSRAVIEAPLTAAIQLSIDVLDADGVAALGNPARFGDPDGIDFSAGREIRYGRLRFINAVGSELVDLPVPLRAEYFAGAAQGFVPNLDDSCSTGVSLSLGNFTENLNAGETCVLDTGMPGVSGEGCPAPAPPGQRFNSTASLGAFNLTLSAPGATNEGGVRIDSVVPDWLRFDWDAAAPGDENPSGQATFGLYGGHSSQIYLRELY